MSNFKNGETVGQCKGELRHEDAAQEVTVTGWACANCGRFYGKNEGGARGCCYTDAPCPDCDGRRQRHKIRCDNCYHKWLVRHYHGLEQSSWDGKTALTTWDGDTYWFDEESLIEYCVDHECRPSNMFLIHCHPNTPRFFDLNEWLNDDLPEDDSLSGPEVVAVEKAVNDYLASIQPLSWWPDHKSRPTDDDLKRLDLEYVRAVADGF